MLLGHFAHELLFACLQALAHCIKVFFAPLCLSEDTPGLLFFFDVMFDVFAEDLHFGVVKIIARFHRFNFGDQLLRAVMLDLRFVEHVVFDVPPLFCIENLFFDFGVDLQSERNLIEELELFSRGLELLVLVEPFFNLAVIFLRSVIVNGSRVPERRVRRGLDLA
jgi:hypothetical protein